MNKYELALVVSAKIEDEARNAVVGSVKDIVANAGGQNIEIIDGGRKKLAYDIQKMSEGNYYFLQFDAEPTAPADIEQRVRIKDNVLRFLCVSMFACSLCLPLLRSSASMRTKTSPRSKGFVT